MKPATLMLSLALAAISLGSSAAGAADTPGAPDCATADAVLTKLIAQPMSAVGATANLDQNFVAAMHQMSDHGMQMAKLEAACGKDAKTRDAAQKMLHDMQDELKLLQSGH
jgi:uncharacterized protein (DUF305 family)